MGLYCSKQLETTFHQFCEKPLHTACLCDQAHVTQFECWCWTDSRCERSDASSLWRQLVDEEMMSSIGGSRRSTGASRKDDVCWWIKRGQGPPLDQKGWGPSEDQITTRFITGSKEDEVHHWIKRGQGTFMDHERTRCTGGSKGHEVQWWIKRQRSSSVDQKRMRSTGESREDEAHW